MAASAVSAAAETTTAASSGATSATSSATTATGTTASIWTTVSTTIRSTISAAFGTAISAGSGYGCIAVEVGFVVGEIGAAFDGQRRSMCGFAPSALASAVFRRKFAATHFCALFLEDGFARQANAVAFDGQHFYQYLVAFFQFVADILDAVFRDFADVQQAVGAWDNLDESAEIRQAGDCTKIGFAYLGRGCEVADDLQGLDCRSLVV